LGDTARAWFEQRIDDAAAVAAISERYGALLQRFASALQGAAKDLSSADRLSRSPSIESGVRHAAWR
jgi:hypothetical protein